jgi:hypothetical protein
LGHAPIVIVLVLVLVLEQNRVGPVRFEVEDEDEHDYDIPGDLSEVNRYLFNWAWGRRFPVREEELAVLLRNRMSGPA